MRLRYDYRSHFPVEDRHGRLTVAGVPLWLDPPCPIPEDLQFRIAFALKAVRQAAGVNIPMAFEPNVWLHRCVRCNAPFIDVPEARLCSDQCRALAKRDSARKAVAKRSERRAEERAEQSVTCRQCGARLAALRSTKRFCSVTCRVAAHRKRAALALTSPERRFPLSAPCGTPRPPPRSLARRLVPERTSSRGRSRDS
jgi:predicted nucleic acid-binding Zn ribbon protein